ncbi:hypothetical protein BD779DRAFT_628154 [Infundibulicybe gibba]|nr:hypothetical protein BD779DRAFT_628154 [Infundibulicybe gibba]
MTGLLSLPIELIEQVGEELYLDTRSQKNFRQTCTQVDLALAPQLFSHLVIDVKKTRIGPSVSQLQALATKSARIVQYVHTIEIRRLTPYFDPQNPFARPNLRDLEAKWAYMKLEKHLAAALSTISNVRTVMYAMLYLSCSSSPSTKPSAGTRINLIQSGPCRPSRTSC